MKSIRHILYGLLVILLAQACVEDKIPSGAQLADVPCVLNADKSAISFTAQGEARQLVIKSQNVSWELTGAPEWLTISPKSGSGDATVALTATENKDIDNNRAAVLQLKSTTSKYEFTKSITVSQNAAEIYLTPSETSLTLSPQAVQKEIPVSSNVEWEAISSASWLTVTKPTTTTLSLNASENTTAGTRKATVTLRRVGKTAALATISVVQSEAGVTGSTEEVTFEVDGGTKSLDIEADVAWSATTSEASWLTVTPTNGTAGKASLGITALANNSTAARSGYVYVNIGTTQKLAIPVSQEGISFDVTGTLENFAAAGSTKQKLTVESNTAWAVLSCPEWLTVTPTKGSKGTCEITLQAAANNSLDSRSATLRIGIEGLTIYKDITVAQESVTIDLGDRSLDFGWESAEREVEITFPGSWSAMASDDWITLSQSSGLGGETIIVTAAANPGEDARTGTITVASEGRSMKITVIQQGQYLKINSTAGEVGAMGGSINLTVTTTVGAAASVEYQGTAKEWLTFESDDKGNYTLQAAYNPSSNNRTAQFVIKPTMSGTNTTCSSGVKFAITQKGRSLSANVSKIVFSVAGGTSETYTITADSTYTITKPEADDWYTLQQDSASCTFSIEATENTTNINNTARTSRLTVSLTGLPSGETKNLVIEVLQHDLYNGYEYVDLGLPSGLKWATCNVGATKPEEYGDCYAWGETEEKENYSWETYKWCNGSENTLTKYCTDSSYGTVDNKTVLDPEDDVAHVEWGGDWRMPTKAEQDELLNNCTWTWTTQNGVDGYKVTGPNGNSIFLPATGRRFWSSSLSGSSFAYYLYFNSGYYGWDGSSRYVGGSVRPVCSEKYTVYVGTAGSGAVAIKDVDGTSATIEWGSTVTVVATPDEGYLFDGWYANGNETPVSVSAEYTFTVSGDVTLTAKFVPIVCEAVDLGLPSGLKWATCNVGATKPEEYGGYYAWGETEKKSDYVYHTYKWYKGASTNITKYCVNSAFGMFDNKIILEPEDDVAHVKWGGNWRMPTSSEMEELYNNCTWTWTVQNGVNGYRVTGPNGNSIFLPAAGYYDCYETTTEALNRGNHVRYWSSSLCAGYCANAYYLNFEGNNYGWYSWMTNTNRACGFSVRPVCDDALVEPDITYMVSVSCDDKGTVYINNENTTSASVGKGGYVTVTASPNAGYEFLGWFIGDSNYNIPASCDATCTFTVSGDIALVAKFRIKTIKDGYEYVDLGLPSGLKWAAYNVGATKPEEYGGYYAWGETEEKENYSWETYKWCNGSYTTMTKYCTDSNYGTVDNKTVLDPEDDVAHVKWGGSWRMPTNAELYELYSKCTRVWTTQNGVIGYRFIGTNGNSIFLPAAGSDEGFDEKGYYWTSSGLGNSHAGSLNFSEVVGSGQMFRCSGYSVRPVCSEGLKYTVTVSSAGNGSVGIKDAEGTSATIEVGSTVTVVATTDEGYMFSGWYANGNETPVSTAAEYTFTVSEDVALTAKFEKAEINGHECVDLGLPSGLKWATCNVGATKPEEFGGYYAWGETEEKEDYSLSTYKWCNGSYDTMTKYCTDSNYGTVDNKTVLDPEDDVAHVKWGGSWRMPTEAELNELRNNCTWTWTTQNGVNGYKVTSKTNGNSIFLPAAGYRDGASLYSSGSYGFYLSSSLDEDYGFYFSGLCFESGRYGGLSDSRGNGISVRPVSE